MSIDNPLSSAQTTVVALVAGLVIVSVAAPMVISPGTTSPATNNGTTYQPAASNTSTTTSDIGALYRGWGRTSVNPSDLARVPTSHVNDTDQGGSPTVSSTKGSQTLQVKSITHNGSAALNVTDNQNHDGRWMSVSSDWLTRHHETIPEVATVQHESGDEYTTPVRNRSGEAMFYVRTFSSNLITFGGEVELVDRPAATGTTHLYEIRDLDNASDPVVELTGKLNTERDTASWTGVTSGETLPLSIGGADLDPTNATAMFTGEGETTSNSATGTGSGTVEVGGDTTPENQRVSVTGQGSTTSASASGTGSGTVDVGGNVDPENQQVSVTGQGSTTSASTSGTSISPSGSDTISVGGNVDSTNDEISVTGNGQTTTTQMYSGSDQTMPIIGDDVSGNPIQYETEFVPDESGKLTSVSVFVENEDGDGSNFNADIRIAPGNHDESATDGTLVKSGWSTDAGYHSTATINFDTAYDVTAGQKYHLNIETTNTDGDGDRDQLVIDTEGGAAESWSVNGGYGNGEGGYSTFEYHIVAAPNNVDVTTSSGSTVTIGDLTPGETVSKSIDVGPADSQLDFTGSGAGSLDYTLSYTEVTATKDPSVDVDGDGTADASWSGVFRAGESTSTKSVSSLSTGSNSLSTSTASGPQPEWTVDYTEVTATKNPSVDIDGDGSTDASWSGVFRAGESTSAKSVSSLSTGSNSLSMSTASGPQPEWTVDYTEVTATKNPSVDIDGDGSAEASWSGIYRAGETTTTQFVSGLSTGSNSLSTSTTSGPQPDWTVEYGEISATVDPQLDINADGSIEASYNGVLEKGETATVPINLSTSDTSAQVALAAGTVTVDLAYTERVRTRDAGVLINGNPLRMSGPLANGSSTTLTGNASWLQSGENTVEVLAGDGSLSGDAPDRQVAMSYEHDLTSKRAVEYSDESLSERYNISRTYLSDRQNASLSVPHAENVLTIRELGYRINSSGSWNSIPESAVTMDGTALRFDISSLVGGEVSAGTTIDIRSTGSKVEVNRGSIEVVRATPVGFDISSRVKLTDWNNDSWLGLAETPQSNLVHYGANESFSGESDYAELSTEHGQRLHFPDAPSGSAVGVRAVPLVIEPVSGSVHISVPENQNETSPPRFFVDPGPSSGDSFNVTYVSASEGVWYGAFETGTTKRLDRAQGQRTLTITSDDVGSVIEIRQATAPSDEPSTTIFEAVQRGNLLGLSLLFGSIAMLVIAGRRPESSRAVVESIAMSISSLVAGVPAVGDRLEGPTESAVQQVGNVIVKVGEYDFLSIALSAAAIGAAIQSGYIDVGPEIGAMLAVGAIGLVSLLLLVRYDAFTAPRWGGIVVTTGVVALQALGEGDVIIALINSDGFIFIILGVGYIAFGLLQEYRANNGPNDDRPQVVIESEGGSD